MLLHSFIADQSFCNEKFLSLYVYDLIILHALKAIEEFLDRDSKQEKKFT